jgi:hypothetical protein
MEVNPSELSQVHFEGAWPVIEGTGVGSPDAAIFTEEDVALLKDEDRLNGDSEAEEDEGRPSQNARIEAYNNQGLHYSSSDDEVDDPNDDSSNEDEEVQYVSHNAEEESDVDETSEYPEVVDNHFPESLPAIFDVAAVAAVVAEAADRDSVPVSEPEPGKDFDKSFEQQNVIFEATAVGDKTEGRDVSSGSDTRMPQGSIQVSPGVSLLCNSSTITETRSIPLLAPPPGDKLKKWEESELRPFKHIEAVKNKECNLEIAGNFDLFAGQPNELQTGMGELEDIKQNPSDSSVESSADKSNPTSKDMAQAPLMSRLHIQNPLSITFGEESTEVELLSKTSSCERNVPVDDGKIVINSHTMAEKVAIAEFRCGCDVGRTPNFGE